MKFHGGGRLSAIGPCVITPVTLEWRGHHCGSGLVASILEPGLVWDSIAVVRLPSDTSPGGSRAPYWQTHFPGYSPCGLKVPEVTPGGVFLGHSGSLWR